MQISRKAALKLKSKLPYGALEEISRRTGLHYNTVKIFQNERVIEEATKYLAELKEKTKKADKELIKKIA